MDLYAPDLQAGKMARVMRKMGCAHGARVVVPPSALNVGGTDLEHHHRYSYSRGPNRYASENSGIVHYPPVKLRNTRGKQMILVSAK